MRVTVDVCIDLPALLHGVGNEVSVGKIVVVIIIQEFHHLLGALHQHARLNGRQRIAIHREDTQLEESQRVWDELDAIVAHRELLELGQPADPVRQVEHLVVVKFEAHEVGERLHGRGQLLNLIGIKL